MKEANEIIVSFVSFFLFFVLPLHPDLYNIGVNEKIYFRPYSSFGGAST